LRKSKKSLGFVNDAEAKVVADELNVSPEAVLEMDKRMSLPELGFDLPHGSEDSYAPVDYIEADDANPEGIAIVDSETDIQESSLKDSLTSLDDRSRDIVTRRWLADKKATLQDLGAEYGISLERVRQIEKSALGKMRNVLQEQIA
jgi:RNA polymerase sigma-32 factor